MTNVMDESKYNDQHASLLLKPFKIFKHCFNHGSKYKSQLLGEIREIKQPNAETNALLKPTTEFNSWFTKDNCSASSIDEISEHLDPSCPILLQAEQSIPSGITDEKIYSNVSQVRTNSIECQAYLNSSTIPQIDEPDHIPITSADNQADSADYSITDKLLQIDTLPNEILSEIYNWARKIDKKTEESITLVNSRAYSLIKFYRYNTDFKNITLTVKVIFDESKFNRFLQYLASPECKTEKLTINGIQIGRNRLNRLLEALEKNTSVTDLGLVGCGVNSSNISKIARLKRLVALNIKNSDFDSAGAKHIAKLSNLIQLNIAYNRLRTTGAKHIAKLKSLTQLDISGNGLNVAGAEHIAKLSNLIQLNISYNRICDAGAEHIAKLSNLIQLNIGSNDLGVIGAEHIAKLSKLTQLYISGNDLKVAGVEHIAKLSNLTQLNIRKNKIDAAMAEHIANKLSNLSELIID
jgi:Leucine-rich repeat (LRR) protein